MKREYAILIGKGILTVGAALVPFLLLYLTVAFVDQSLDAGKWHVAGRSAVGLFGLMFGCITGGLAGTALFYPKAFR